MTQDDVGQRVDWASYAALTVEPRENRILLITLGEPAGVPVQSATRRHRELTRVWRDFDDDSDVRVAVITGRDRFYPVGGVTEMLKDPGNYETIVGFSRTVQRPSKAWSTATCPSCRQSTVTRWVWVCCSACSPT